MALKIFLAPLAVLAIGGLGAAEVAAHPKLIGNGSTRVSGCGGGGAHLTPHVAYNDATSGYQITTVSIATNSACVGLTYRLSLLGADRRQLAETVGHLGAYGSAVADFTSRHVPAEEFGGVSMTLTGAGPTAFR